jgi:hypothetical protein
MVFLRKHWAAVAVAAITALTVAVVRFEGRVWFCDCWQVRVWIASAWSSHTSQHLFDPYSLTHVEHGLIFYWALVWLAPRWAWQGRLVAATAIEATWEIVENSPWVINRYREATAALGYTGDSVVNVAGDVLACVLGFAVARRLGKYGTLALIAAIELGLLWAIRDNLFLNVVMLFLPLEFIKEWQVSGQA